MKVQGAVAEEPAADIHPCAGAVVQFDPVAREAGVCEDFVDDDGFADGERVVGGAVNILRSDIDARAGGVECVGGSPLLIAGEVERS